MNRKGHKRGPFFFWQKKSVKVRVWNRFVSISLADWVAATGAYSLPLYAAPGSYWNYANPNFSLAGAVVERVSGMPYDAYMSGTIWDPNGMPLSTIDPTEVISTGNYTVGWHNGRPVEPGSFDYPMLAPAGTAYSTPSELVTWALSMQSSTPGVLNVASRQAMQARRMPTDYVPWMDYGYGIFVTDWRDVANPDQRVYLLFLFYHHHLKRGNLLNRAVFHFTAAL